LFHIVVAWLLRGDSLFGSTQNNWMSLKNKTRGIEKLKV
jgi:hypothetical protein